MKSKLLEFYESNRDRFEHLDPLPVSSVQKTLQNTNKALGELRKLCGGNEDTMFVVLHLFLHLPKIRRLEGNEKESRRRPKERNKPRDIKSFINQLSKEAAKHITNAELLAKLLDSDIDTDRLEKKVISWIAYRVTRKLQGLDELDSAIRFVSMIDPETDYTLLKQASGGAKDDKGVDFNDWITAIYKICRDPSNLTSDAIYTGISNLLNFLDIPNKQGQRFTRGNVRGLIKRTLLSSS